MFLFCDFIKSIICHCHVFSILMLFFSTNETEYKDSVEDKPTINGEYLFVVDSI